MKKCAIVLALQNKMDYKGAEYGEQLYTNQLDDIQMAKFPEKT